MKKFKINSATLGVLVVAVIATSNQLAAAEAWATAQIQASAVTPFRAATYGVAAMPNALDVRKAASAAHSALVGQHGAGGLPAHLQDTEAADLMTVVNPVTRQAYIDATLLRLENKILTLLTRATNAAALGDVIFANVNGGAHTFGADDISGDDIAAWGGHHYTQACHPADGTLGAFMAALHNVLSLVRTEADLDAAAPGIAAIANPSMDAPFLLSSLPEALRTSIDTVVGDWLTKLWATGPANNILAVAIHGAVVGPVPAAAGNAKTKASALTAGSNIANQTGNSIIAAIRDAITH